MPMEAAADRVGGGIGRGIAAIGAARVAAIVLDGATYILLARYLGPAPYGHYISIVAFITLIDLAADMMTLDVTVREIAADPARTRLWLTSATVLRCTIALVGVAAFLLYAAGTGLTADAGLAGAVWLAAWLLPVGALRTPLAAFRAHMRMHLELAVLVITRLANLVLVLGVAMYGGSLVQLFAATLASRALLAALSWGLMFRRFDFRPVFDRRAVWRITRESLPMGVSGLFVAVQLKADIVLIGTMIGSHAAGVYGVVAQLPEYFLYVPVIFTTPILPVMSRCMAEKGAGDFQRLYQAMFDTIVVIVIPIAIVGMTIPRQTVVWLFGNEFAAAGTVLPLLMASVVCMWISHATAIATVAARLQDHFTWIQALCVAVFAVLCLTLIPVLDIRGAALARLAAAALAPALTYWLLRRQVGVTLSGRPVRRAALAAIGMVGAVLVLSEQPLLVVCAAGLALYGAGLWLTGFNPLSTLVEKEIRG